MNQDLTRLNLHPIACELARYNSITKYSPKIGDFIIWHGWFRKWFGVVNGIDGNRITVIKENLPKLVFSIPENKRYKYMTEIYLDNIRGSSGGEYAINQDGVWFIDD